MDARARVRQLRGASSDELAVILRAADQADIQMRQGGSYPLVPSPMLGRTEVTLLGSLGCRYGMLAGGAGGWLLRSARTQILIDPGPAALAHLLLLQDAGLFSFAQLDAIACSHLHPDHYADVIPCLEGMLAYGSHRPTLIGNSTVIDRFAAFSPFHLAQIDAVPLAHPTGEGRGEPHVKIGDMVMYATPTLHLEERGKIRTGIGFAVRTPGGSIWYTSDTNLYPGLTRAVRDLIDAPELVIAHADAANLDQPAERTASCHLQGSDVLPIAADLSPRSVLIQHYDQAYAHPDYRIAQAVWLQRHLDTTHSSTSVLPGASGLQLTLGAGTTGFDLVLPSPEEAHVREYLRTVLTPASDAFGRT